MDFIIFIYRRTFDECATNGQNKSMVSNVAVYLIIHFPQFDVRFCGQARIYEAKYDLDDLLGLHSTTITP
jgi:hypothetical protein